MFKRLIVVLVLLAVLVTACATPLRHAARSPCRNEPPARSAGRSRSGSLSSCRAPSLTWLSASPCGMRLIAIQTEMGGEAALEIKYSENMFKVPDAAAAIRDYASQGFDVVIAHGSQYGSSVQEIAPDFPSRNLCLGNGCQHLWHAQRVCLHRRC